MFDTEVQAGIAVAEEKGLDWKAATRDCRFDMCRGDLCILGITLGDYRNARDAWGVDTEWMAAHGFVITEKMYLSSALAFGEYYEQLTRAWRRAAELVEV